MQGYQNDPFYHQRGQALFLVLIAIALFAALAYVVTQATPGNHAAAPASALKTPARVAAYPAAIQSSVKKIVSTGVDAAELDFQPDGEGKAAVFSSAFGIPYRSPAPALGVEIEWSFKGISKDNRGFFVTGAGTDGPKGKDVIAYLDNVPKTVCEDINEALGLPREPLAEVPTVDLDSKGGGAKDKAGKNPFTFAAHAVDPKPGACVQNGDKYVYYYVIVAK
jgi:hypothetical protein